MIEFGVLMGITVVPISLGILLGGVLGKAIVVVTLCILGIDVALVACIFGTQAWGSYDRKRMYRGMSHFLAQSCPPHIQTLRVQALDRIGKTAELTFPFPLNGSAHLRLRYTETQHDTRYIQAMIDGLFANLPKTSQAVTFELARETPRGAVLTCTYAQHAPEAVFYKDLVFPDGLD